jgi:hypothetical protein
MKSVRAPFGPAHRGLEVIWPSRTGPSSEPGRGRRSAELWEQTFETFPGERVLEDAAESAVDGQLVLARYLTVRIVIHAAREEWDRFAAETERLAAMSYISALPPRLPERQWLRATLDSVSETGAISTSTVSRLAAAAASAARHGHMRGSFALYHTAYIAASGHGWHRQAARIAQAIAAAAAAGDGARSHRLWTRRANVHTRRAAA